MAICGSILAYILYAVLALAGAIYLWIKNKHSYWQRRGVPTIQPNHWLLGNFREILSFKKSPSLVLGDFYKRMDKNERFYGMYILHMPFLLVKDPQLIKQMMIKDFDVFSNRYFSQRNEEDKASYNLFSIENPEWKHLRVKMSPLFTSGKIKKLFHLMVETSDSMKEYLEKRSMKNSLFEVDIKDVYMKYSTDVISSLAFGVRTSSFGDPVSEFYIQSRRGFKPSIKGITMMLTAFFFPQLMKYFKFRVLNDSREYFSQLFWDSYNERQKSGVKRGDLIDYLVELSKENSNSEFKFEGDVLLGQSLIFFIAGRETSTSTMSFALYELAKNPKLQEKARKEIREILKSHGFTYEGVQKMTYLNQVISETLRLYPPAPILDRVTGKDYVIPETNIVLEKGTPVYAVLSGIQVDPDNFPDPLRFDPDRFSEERKGEIAPHTYMPFGDGPRVCIGMRVGLLQTAVGIITILNNYEILLNPTASYMPEPHNFFLTPCENFILNLKKIEADN